MTSNAWRVWTQRNEVYIACRDNFREVKVSLHASGRWRMGYTNEAITKNPALVPIGENRAWEVWDEPPPLVPDVVLAFNLHFLVSELAVRPDQRDPKAWADVVHIGAPPLGTMVTVALFVTRRDVLLEASGRQSFHLADLELQNGRFAKLVAYVAPAMPAILETGLRAARERAEAAGFPTPPEAFGYVFGHDESGARFIMTGRVNR